jgi:hypothetical protein
MTALWRREPALIVGGVLELAIVGVDSWEQGLGWGTVVKAVLVAALAWMIRQNVYSPATYQKDTGDLTGSLHAFHDVAKLQERVIQEQAGLIAGRDEMTAAQAQVISNQADDLDRLLGITGRALERLKVVDPDGYARLSSGV